MQSDTKGRVKTHSLLLVLRSRVINKVMGIYKAVVAEVQVVVLIKVMGI